MGYMSTMTIQQPSQASFYDDDGAESSAGESGKDKGRGSYKCGRVSDMKFNLQPRFSNQDASRVSFPISVVSRKKDMCAPIKPKLNVALTNHLRKRGMLLFK